MADDDLMARLRADHADFVVRLQGILDLDAGLADALNQLTVERIVTEYGVRYRRPDREHVVGPYSLEMCQDIIENPPEHMVGKFGFSVELVKRTVTTTAWVTAGKGDDDA